MSFCLVKGCNTNHHRIYTFPGDTRMKMKWLQSFVKKDHFFVTASAGVCSRHFRPTDFIQLDGADSRGVLRVEAIPSRCVTKPKRKIVRSPPNKGLMPVETVSIVKEEATEVVEVPEDYVSVDCIVNYEELVSNYRYRLKTAILDQYTTEVSAHYFTFYQMKFETTGQVTILNSLVISKDLDMKVYVHNELVTESSAQELSISGKISLYSQLENLLELILGLKSSNLRSSVTFRNNLSLSIYAIEEILKERQVPESEETELTVSNITTIKDQLRQIQDRKNKFSSSTIMNCFNIHGASPDAYKYLSSIMYLPEASELKQLVATEMGSSKAKNYPKDSNDNENGSSDEESEQEFNLHSCK